MGLSFLVAEADRLPQLNAVVVPTGVDEAAVRRRLLEDFGIEIGAGLGALAGRVWRVGLLGQSATLAHVTAFLAALEDILSAMNAGIETGTAVEAASAAVAAG